MTKNFSISYTYLILDRKLVNFSDGEPEINDNPVT